MDPTDISRIISSNIGVNNGLPFRESLAPLPKYTDEGREATAKADALSGRIKNIRDLLESMGNYNLPGKVKRKLDSAMDEVMQIQRDMEYEEYEVRSHCG